MKLSVIIPTYNRPRLLERCVRSVLIQTIPPCEVLVVDDCSPNTDSELICRQFPEVRFLRQDRNRGPGPARNLGLQLAQGDWVLPVDDDDELLPDAIETVSRSLAELERESSTEYCSIQFACVGSKLGAPFRILTIDDFIQDRIPGSFPPVLHRERFLQSGFAYPEIRIGGESVLWWEVARQYGIPTWDTPFMRYHDDAGAVRLTDFRNQVRRAAEYAQLQELILEKHGDLLAERAPQMLHKRRLGAAVYWLLAGQPQRAKPFLRQLGSNSSAMQAAAWQVLPWIPAPLIRQAFLTYRDLTAGRQLQRPRAAA